MTRNYERHIVVTKRNGLMANRHESHRNQNDILKIHTVVEC